LFFSNNNFEVIAVISSLFVVYNLLQLLVVSCSEDKILINQGIKVVDFYWPFNVAVLEDCV
jgi:hypothetical protein